MNITPVNDKQSFGISNSIFIKQGLSYTPKMHRSILRVAYSDAFLSIGRGVEHSSHSLMGQFASSGKDQIAFTLKSLRLEPQNLMDRLLAKFQFGIDRVDFGEGKLKLRRLTEKPIRFSVSDSTDEAIKKISNGCKPVIDSLAADRAIASAESGTGIPSKVEPFDDLKLRFQLHT